MSAAWLRRRSSTLAENDADAVARALSVELADFSVVDDAACTHLRQRLRAATAGSHERLHGHPGFAAIQDSTITIPAYRALLVRLYGFYVPFETAAGAGGRGRLLAEDLQALGVLTVALDASGFCPYVPDLDSAERQLGAAYVTEGAALGGRVLGQNLARLFRPGSVHGRQFFLGRGAGTGEAWRAYLARLSQAQCAPAAAQSAIVAAAVETFAAFEAWLTGWGGPAHG